MPGLIQYVNLFDVITEDIFHFVMETLTDTMKVSFLSTDKSTTSSCVGDRTKVTINAVLHVFGFLCCVLPCSPKTHVALVGDQIQQPFLNPQQVGCRRHDHVDEDLWNDGDEGVLPGEGVEEGRHGVDDLGQRPVASQRSRGQSGNTLSGFCSDNAKQFFLQNRDTRR